MTQQAPSSELTNDEVTVSFQELPSCKIEMTVKAEEKLLKEAKKKGVKAVNKEITLPGFRKGKAPEELVLKKYAGSVEKEMHKVLADLSFAAAQKLANVPVLNNSSRVTFDLKKVEENAAELLFTFETEPKIPKVKQEDFEEKEVEKAEVGEKQVEEAVRQMLFFYAEWTPVTDRAIEEGDYIMIDLDTMEDGKASRVFNQVRFEVSKKRMAGWMKELVEGAKSGDVLEGVSKPDENASEEEKKEFSNKPVRITVLKVEKATLPELSDEFAQKVGSPNVEKMKQSIEELLNKQADEGALEERRKQANAFFLEHYSFELPESLINAEKKHRITQLAKEPGFKAKWDKMTAEDRKELDAKVTKESKDAVKLFYLSRQIVRDQSIPVTEREVESRAAAIYREHGIHDFDAKTMSNEVYALALSEVILTKAQDFILKKA